MSGWNTGPAGPPPKETPKVEPPKDNLKDIDLILRNFAREVQHLEGSGKWTLTKFDHIVEPVQATILALIKLQQEVLLDRVQERLKDKEIVVAHKGSGYIAYKADQVKTTIDKLRLEL